MASGHVNRIKRPNTWLHRPMLQNVKKLLPTRSRPHMAPFGHGPTTDLSPLSGVERKSDFGAGKTAFVKVCGCRPHEGGAARTGAGVRKPPMEETAGGVARWRVRRYGDLAAVECEYNFCDMARTLRMGENTFRRPCNFKELRVVKRAHITTFALCAWWQPLYRIGRTNIST